MTVLKAIGQASPLDPADVQITVQRGTGPGGQHRNKTESAVRAVHVPTGLAAWCDSRSQHQNRIRALEVLAARVAEVHQGQAREVALTARNEQRSGERAFTWTAWRDQVTDHRTGRKAPMAAVLRGKLDLLIG